MCSEKHDEVIYEGKYCPACDLVNQVEELEKTVERLQNELEETEGVS